MAIKRPGFPWLLSLAALVALAVLLSLGTWQLQRLAWKEGLIASADAAAGARVLPLEEVLRLPDPEFRPVMLTCPGLARAPFVELQTLESKQMGVRLVSLCQTGQLQVLVDRGFIATEVSARPVVIASDTMPSVLTGVLRRVPQPSAMAPKPEGARFYARDPEAMAQVLKAEGPVLGLTLFAQTAINPELPDLKPSVPPVAFSNNHLGYALTWFGLAIALIIFYAVLLRRRLARKDT